MNVLVQEWTPGKGGQLTSISKDRKQLETTIQELAQKPPDSDENELFNWQQSATPCGDADELVIPDDSPFAHMVENGTVFLNDDEMDLIWDNLPDGD